MFNGIYGNNRVLVIGHTGFKGSWLTLWLLTLNANVAGYSAYLPSEPCMFEVLGLKNRIANHVGDIRDYSCLKEVFNSFRPEIVFHLAAQAIVRKAYETPKTTFDTNVTGTVNVLECIRTSPFVKTAVIITSDKCYHNREWIWGYRENDRLGGDDPYSASKACAEIVCHAYVRSFFINGDITRISTARAGNVIGGGDWANDRIIPDCVRALSVQRDVTIRSLLAIRPWQHVLEPISGYLWLNACLYDNVKLHGEAFNFGPDQTVNKSVKELIELFIFYWGKGAWVDTSQQTTQKENSFLKLSSDKSLSLLKWHSVLSFDDTVRLTVQWYTSYYGSKDDMFNLSNEQITSYISMAIQKNMPWTQD
ncbi:CDP-glucose-4,6-dehydratase [Candidatus Magnetobacterium bavaricum]|uniref:CDP-glucose-4,6-dehydratase n=1 Tax=Candidatus Magnetobacterium bavaricum TaxID=29290 RepID=A0A0F3GHA2_9BACT|nr:CDP-glucose-4,6-dehydratase [Candidatus Magnetobacterium bavaricum]